MPVSLILLQPDLTETFWVGLISKKDYPAPREQKNLDGTERLKRINPSNRFILLM